MEESSKKAEDGWMGGKRRTVWDEQFPGALPGHTPHPGLDTAAFILCVHHSFNLPSWHIFLWVWTKYYGFRMYDKILYYITIHFLQLSMKCVNIN